MVLVYGSSKVEQRPMKNHDRLSMIDLFLFIDGITRNRSLSYVCGCVYFTGRLYNVPYRVGDGPVHSNEMPTSGGSISQQCAFEVSYSSAIRHSTSGA